MISQGDAEPTFVRDFDDAVSFGFIVSISLCATGFSDRNQSVFLGPALKLWPRGLWPAKLRHWADAQNRTEAVCRDILATNRHAPRQLTANSTPVKVLTSGGFRRRRDKLDIVSTSCSG